MKAALVGFLLLMSLPGLASAAPRLTTQIDTLNPPILEPTPTPEPLVLRGVGTTWIELLVNAPWPPGNVYQGSSTLYRQDLGGATRRRTTP